jgi:large subunit ribosomal protein L10
MPPRLRTNASRLILCPYHQKQLERAVAQQARLASTAAAAITAVPTHQTVHPVHPTNPYPPTKPPSFKPPEFRKSQLLRQYASVLQSCPLILIFQHNNLKSNEWVALRRELAQALRKTDEKEHTNYADTIKLQIVQSGILSAALNLIAFYNPNPAPHHSSNSTRNKSSINSSPSTIPATQQPTHLLSTHAHKLALRRSQTSTHGLETLLSGPLALFTFPALLPSHLATTLSLFSPSPQFPAPKRRTSPTYYDAAVQSGLQKLILLGARVEGKVMDAEGVAWVGGIEGGLEGLRAELVRLVSGWEVKSELVRVLDGVGSGLVGALEGSGRGLWGTLDGRRRMLEDGKV